MKISNDWRLGVFGLFIAGLGWGAAGYQINGVWQGIGMGLAAAFIVGICLLNINKE